MQRFILTILISLTFSGLFSQTDFLFGLEGGAGFNKKIEIAGTRVSGPNAILGAFHTTVKRNSSKKLLLEVSAFTMFIRNKGEIGNVGFVIEKSKLGLDVVAGYNFLKQTQFLMGMTVSTVPALDEINFYRPDNLKFDLLFKVNQILTPKISSSLKVRTLLNSLGNDVLLEDPRSSITLGINYHLRKA